MATQPKFVKGQPVKVTSNMGNRAEDAIVTSVGRAIVHVSTPGDPKGYRIETGALNDKDYPMYGHVFTVEEWDIRERRSAVTLRLRSLGVSGTVLQARSTEALEQVVAVLEADGAVAIS